MSGCNDFNDLLKGGDLRSIGKANEAVKNVSSQDSFDALFDGLHHNDRRIVMRTADAIEKMTRSKPEFLNKHKNELLKLCADAKEIELKWHLAQLVPRIRLTPSETGEIWQLLRQWIVDRHESRIVRTNSLQALFDLQKTHVELKNDFFHIIEAIREENIPSLNARIKQIEKSRWWKT